MKIIVIGGAGYIGSHACKALATAGHYPVVYDNLSTGHRWAVRWGELEEGDILDRERLASVLRKHRPDAVMHFAALAYVGESVTAPDRYQRVNVTGTLNVLDAMREAEVPRLVFSSSCATYGVPAVVPITVDAPQQPVNPYGWTKYYGERMIADYCAAFGLGAVALRYFNAAGADPDGETGEVHVPETHLIPLALQAAAGDRPLLQVYGADYPTPDGTCVRDYVHVSDLADAHVRALQACHYGEMRACNLGLGQGYSVREVLNCVERVTGRPVPAAIAARRPGDPPALVADPQSATALLGWRPQIDSLLPMVETAWRWYQTAPVANKMP
jgi:UDP-arabinose 4-epimerase